MPRSRAGATPPIGGGSTVPPVRRGLPGLAAVVTVLLVVSGVPGSATVTDPDQAELDEQVEEARARAAAAEDQLEAIAFDLVAARNELVDLQKQLDDADARLRMLDGQLALAERELDERARRADAAAGRAAATAATLAAVRLELATEEQRLDDQAALSYMRGTTARPVAMLQLMEDADDPGSLAADVHILGVVLDAQALLVDRVDELRRRSETIDRQARVARLEAESAEAVAADAVALVEGLREQAAAVRADAEVARDRQSVLLASLQADAAEQEAVLASVSAEIDRLEAERAAAVVATVTGPSVAGGGPCPVDGAVANRDFSNDWGDPRPGGRSHEGTDIFAYAGTPVRAMADGTVKELRFADEGLGGRYVSIWVAPGEHWYHAHLQSVAGNLSVGAAVTRGQLIGTVGNSGNARGTPPHLHIGNYVNDVARNPYPVLAERCR